MIRSKSGWRQALWSCFALVLGACFGGDFVRGLPCQSDEECGPQLSCVEGLCGGPGDLSLCGNGLLDQGEECDDANTQEGDECTPACRVPVCGDGFVAPGEQCDDGNTNDADECKADCSLPAVCGNGTVEIGEECDDGNTAQNDTCTPVCLLPVCGDGYLVVGEECDDGNDIGTDACTPSCALPVCGDGFLNAEGEECDDGNDDEFDECTTTCIEPPETPVLALSFSSVKKFEFSWAPALGAEYYELLESADVGEAFVPVGEGIVGESFALTVPLRFRLNASYMLRACSASRCAESEVVDVVGTLAEAVGYFKTSNIDAGDELGYSVDFSDDGNTLAVGARGEDSGAKEIDGDQADDSEFFAGAVYIFVRNGANEWSQQAYLKASNTEENDRFGSSVALSGDGKTLAVGAIFEDSGEMVIDGEQSDNSAQDAGAVYVFVRNDMDQWSQQVYLKASNADVGDEFGHRVALSGDGDTLAVSALEEASNATEINGDGTNNSLILSGAVYVFVRNGMDQWSEQAYVKASNTGWNDQFGHSIALADDGNTLAVGAMLEDSSATGIDGNQGNGSSTGNAGAVYVFVRNGMSQWSQQAYVKASNTGELDQFGYSVALSGDGNTLAVGARGEASSATGIDGDQTDDSVATAGAVYVFVRDGMDAWSQQSYLKASNTRGGDQFGHWVTLSADASTLAVGAPFENFGDAGISAEPMTFAFNAGAVYLY
ncbi:MAG: DUF4215 domain-containing protein [Myxococcota bacterium]